MSTSTETLYTKIPTKAGEKYHCSNFDALGKSFAIANLSKKRKGLSIVVTKDIFTSGKIQRELQFFLPKEVEVLTFPDWETLPYDNFSPHEDIVSERLATLYRLPHLKNAVLIIAVSTLMQYVVPRSYIESYSFFLKQGEKINLEFLRERLSKYGYSAVSQVMEHGEFAVRGSLIDIFPMGSTNPYRIDFFDDEVDSIRTFDPDSQLSDDKVASIQLLPAKEYSLAPESISLFRQNWRNIFPGNPSDCPIYQNVTNGLSAPGIEYYLRLFFNELGKLSDFLPKDSLIINYDSIDAASRSFWQEVKQRYEQLSHDTSHPLLPPKEIFLSLDALHSMLKQFPEITFTDEKASSLPNLTVDHKASQPLFKLKEFFENQKSRKDGDVRVLFCAESLGRQESLRSVLAKIEVCPPVFSGWQEFCSSDAQIGICVAPIDQGGYLPVEDSFYIAIITEAQLFGMQAITPRRSSKRSEQAIDNAIRNLTELSVGAPVVHVDHGVGRYLGLTKLKAGEEENEFLVIEYADQTKLYVPVTSLHLIGRYGGSDTEHAPLSKLGTAQWEKAKRAVLNKIRDIAAELLNIYAKRANTIGHKFNLPEADYEKFAANFPFQVTEDQQKAIDATIADMARPRLMDRLICGDVGFGKTEVAMRAAFLAVENNKQVAILTPTTLLAEQHYHNFCDRFASWPVKIGMLSRFCNAAEQKHVLDGLMSGAIDIVIGTHKLLQKDVLFKDLGLLVIDEEHRFGVKQKERIKSLRPNVDVLTLTATPIPRTLNMALSGTRDFSIIATPPPGRLAIKTFIQERNNYVIREAVLREILRGGQVYFLHNDIATISKMARDLAELVPEARIVVAHGQMGERDLEHVMTDFYHRRSNVLVCTTIIESGIDIPTANTIVVNRADHFGLAQLHQLRGRVGRSHHQAYAYLLIPSRKFITEDAKKRLDALASREDLGVGFVLATHDLEIRGAGELLGEEQSGQMATIGFDLYLEYLERAVTALKNGQEVNVDEAVARFVTEIDLKIPAFFPDQYIFDINTRLTFYKRIANAKSISELDNLQVELIDRFGLLPQEAKNFFAIAEIRLTAEPLGVSKIAADFSKGFVEFALEPNVDVKKILNLVQKNPHIYRLKKGNKLEFAIKQPLAADLIEFLKMLLGEIKK
ncbi:MAG: transcription-repair coupling factor [Gammaproteobacteria bacterium]